MIYFILLNISLLLAPNDYPPASNRPPELLLLLENGDGAAVLAQISNYNKAELDKALPGWSIIMQAAIYEIPEVVEYLIDGDLADLKTIEKRDKLLKAAAEAGSYRTVELILRRYPDLGVFHILNSSGVYGYTDVVRLLLNRLQIDKLDDTQVSTIVTAAVYSGNIQILEILESMGVNYNNLLFPGLGHPILATRTSPHRELAPAVFKYVLHRITDPCVIVSSGEEYLASMDDSTQEWFRREINEINTTCEKAND